MWKPLTPFGDLMTIAAFSRAVRDGAFVDYDGFGYFATRFRESNVVAKPSTLGTTEVPKSATHVIWFNR